MIFATLVLLMHLPWVPPGDVDTSRLPAIPPAAAASASTDSKTAPHATTAVADSSTKPTLEATAATPESQNSQALSTIRVPTIEPAKPNKIILPDAAPSRRKWLALSIIQHSAAAFDAYSTRQAVAAGAHEDDPLLRPFAGSPAVYLAIQGTPVLLDFAARKMQTSPNPLLRRAWWLPQSASTGLFLFSGIHNLRVSTHP
jgi:hypothetical protein